MSQRVERHSGQVRGVDDSPESDLTAFLVFKLSGPYRLFIGQHREEVQPPPGFIGFPANSQAYDEGSIPRSGPRK